MNQLSLLAFCRRCGAPTLPPRKGGSMTKRTCDPCQKAFDIERKRRYRENNPDARRKEYERHHARYQERAKEYAKKNPCKVKAAQQSWRERNPGVSNAIRAKRRGSARSSWTPSTRRSSKPCTTSEIELDLAAAWALGTTTSTTSSRWPLAGFMHPGTCRSCPLRRTHPRRPGGQP